MSLTLNEARQRLADAERALARAEQGAAYSTSTHSYTRQELGELRAQVTLWHRRVGAIKAREDGAPNPGVIVATFT